MKSVLKRMFTPSPVKEEDFQLSRVFEEFLFTSLFAFVSSKFSWTPAFPGKDSSSIETQWDLLSDCFWLAGSFPQDGGFPQSLTGH